MGTTCGHLGPALAAGDEPLKNEVKITYLTDEQKKIEYIHVHLHRISGQPLTVLGYPCRPRSGMRMFLALYETHPRTANGDPGHHKLGLEAVSQDIKPVSWDLKRVSWGLKGFVLGLFGTLRLCPGTFPI